MAGMIQYLFTRRTGRDTGFFADDFHLLCNVSFAQMPRTWENQLTIASTVSEADDVEDGQSNHGIQTKRKPLPSVDVLATQVNDNIFFYVAVLHLACAGGFLIDGTTA